MKLNKSSIEWALRHVKTMKDTDLFPLPKEIDVLLEDFDNTVNELSNIDLSNYEWHNARRFLIPKKELSYRLATQLNPLDSIIFSAIMYEYGLQIESRRPTVYDNNVFSYRFSPNRFGYLYATEDSWGSFWEHCKVKAEEYDYVVCLDISDFYNQIYHHTIENELIKCGIPNVVNKSIMRLLEKLTTKTSRGIPIGPHGAHLLAEMTLIPVDNLLTIKYDDYCRYSDDIMIFCNDFSAAKNIIYEVAEILDNQQRLVLQNGKTKIYKTNEFKSVCDQMIQDNPINDLEKDMINIFNKYDFNSYTNNDLITLQEEDYSVFSRDNIEGCLQEYLSHTEINYERIKWLYRRLSQIGVDGGVEFTILNIEKLSPAISEIVNYLVSVGESEQSDLDLNRIGDSIFGLLNNQFIRNNIYLKFSILSLFSTCNNYNHINKLISIFKDSPEELKREIILAVFNSQSDKLYSWFFGLKEQAQNFNDWTRSAYYIACSSMISENKKFYLNSLNDKDILVRLIIKWALKNNN